jgi:iron complex transport system substrate-binding protein
MPESRRPKVLLNTPSHEQWYVPGGATVLAQLVSDAGGRYAYADNPSSDVVAVSLEHVAATAGNSDIWFVSEVPSVAALVSLDHRLMSFAAVRRGAVYRNDGHRDARGRDPYWKNLLAMPDVALADMIRLFHPDLLPDYTPVYARRLPRTSS